MTYGTFVVVVGSSCLTWPKSHTQGLGVQSQSPRTPAVQLNHTENDACYFQKSRPNWYGCKPAVTWTAVEKWRNFAVFGSRPPRSEVFRRSHIAMIVIYFLRPE